MTEEDIINEPTAPMVKIGQRVAYKEYYGNEFGTIRWIGRVPQICPEWTVGVEFDNAIGEGDGSLNGRRYFVAKDCFAKFLPLNSVVQVDQHIGRPEPGTMISVMSAAVRPGQMISIQRVSTVHVQHCFLNAPHRRPGHDILAVNNRLHCQCPSCGPCAHVVKPSKSQRLGKAGKNATHMCQFSTYTCCGMESQENALCSYSNEPPPPLKLPPIGNSWMEGSGYLTTLQEQQTKLLPTNEFKQIASGSLDRKHSKRHGHRHHHSKHGHHRHHKNHKNHLETFDDKLLCDLDRRDNEKRIEYLSTQSLTGEEMDKLAEKSISDDQRSYYHESPITNTSQREVNSANLSNTLNGNDLSRMLQSSMNDINSSVSMSNPDGLQRADLDEIDSDSKKDSSSSQANYRSSIDNRYLYPTDNYLGNDVDSEIDSDYRSEHRNSSRFSDKSKNILRSIRSLVSCLTPSSGSNISKRSNQRQFSDATISYTQSEPKLAQVATTYPDDTNFTKDDNISSHLMSISKSSKDLRISERSPIPAPVGYDDYEYKEEPIYNMSKSDLDGNIQVSTKPNLLNTQDKQIDDLYGKIAERILCSAALTHEETDRLNSQMNDNTCRNVEGETINSSKELNEFMARIIKRAAHDEEFSRKILSLDSYKYSYQSKQNSNNNPQNNDCRASPKPVEIDYLNKADVRGDSMEPTSKSLPHNFINQSTTSGSMSISSRESCTSGTSLTEDITTHMNDATINIPVMAGTVPQAFQLSLTLSINPDLSINCHRNNNSNIDGSLASIGGGSNDSQQRSLSAITVSPRYSTRDVNCTSEMVDRAADSNNQDKSIESSKGISLPNGEEANFEQKDTSMTSSPSIAFNGSNPIYATIVRANKKDRPNAVAAQKLDLRSSNIKSTDEVNKSKDAVGIEPFNVKLPNGNKSEEPRSHILEKKMDSREASDSGCENTGLV